GPAAEWLPAHGRASVHAPRTVASRVAPESARESLLRAAHRVPVCAIRRSRSRTPAKPSVTRSGRVRDPISLHPARYGLQPRKRTMIRGCPAEIDTWD